MGGVETEVEESVDEFAILLRYVTALVEEISFRERVSLGEVRKKASENRRTRRLHSFQKFAAAIATVKHVKREGAVKSNNFKFDYSCTPLQ